MADFRRHEQVVCSVLDITPAQFRWLVALIESEDADLVIVDEVAPFGEAEYAKAKEVLG